MLIVSGILMNIPEDLYEAARIDGASPFVMFTKITMPYVLFVTTPYLITQLVGNTTTLTSSTSLQEELRQRWITTRRARPTCW